MAKLKIAMVSPEAAPLARSGGLGDVLGALPEALAQLGHEVFVFIPRYGTISTGTAKVFPSASMPTVNLGGKTTTFSLEKVEFAKSRVPVFLIGNKHYFDRDGLYGDPRTGIDFVDNDERFAMFSLAVLEVLGSMDWKPDVLHLHDWQTSLIPAFLKTRYLGDPEWEGVKTVLTIHNMGYQGLFEGDRFEQLGLPEGYFYPVTGPVEFFGKVNFLKAGIALADRVTTVSETYAKEIQSSEEFGCGLEGVLRQRGKSVTGILNGVDYATWSPKSDRAIARTYHVKNLSGKKDCRLNLVRECGFPLREKSLLLAMITRLADQKGIDLLLSEADELFSLDIQLVVLGAGDHKYHEAFTDLQRRYPDQFRAFLTFDDKLAHRIEAGADAFLMPSRYEPCGLNQMYSMKYGTVPIVRRTGGLADTVRDYDPETGEGTGFVFDLYDSDAMIEAIERALIVFPKKRIWNRLMKAGMENDFSWSASARKYEILYTAVRYD